MATFVTFHAHPDDESITVRRHHARRGRRRSPRRARRRDPRRTRRDSVRACSARARRSPSGGSIGDPARRRRPRRRAGRVPRLPDSGMVGTDTTLHPARSGDADVEEAAERLAAILREEDADVLTVYDDHGGYGHPDHIQVHRVGRRAAELAGTPRVYQQTTNREESYARWRRYAEETGAKIPDFDGHEFGKPAAELTTRVDVTRSPRPSARRCAPRQPDRRRLAVPGHARRDFAEPSAPSGSSARARAQVSPRRICWPAWTDAGDREGR